MAENPNAPRGKRAFGKYLSSSSSKVTDSPAYDASEEDNDPTDVDDSASTMSIPAPSSSSRARTLAAAGLLKGSNNAGNSSRRHHLAASFLSDSDGVDSPTYDGDVESSTTAGPESPHPHVSTLRLGHHHHSTSSTSTLNTPAATPGSGTTTDYINTPGTEEPTSPVGIDHPYPIFISSPTDPLIPTPIYEPAIPSSVPSASLSFNPAALKAEDIQAFVQRAIDGAPIDESGIDRSYKINQPPENRPVRIYADGVYDLFHFGHALQLRQAKLSFPSVYLLAGVCSDELVNEHKAKSIMSHAERIEALRHCRWVDQVVPDAPWVITPDFLEKYQIDYVAHDEDPYKSEGLGIDDTYGDIKRAGKFLPTRRTPGISTSALLERIVDMYQGGVMDRKLKGMGRGDLTKTGHGGHSENSGGS